MNSISLNCDNSCPDDQSYDPTFGLCVKSDVKAPKNCCYSYELQYNGSSGDFNLIEINEETEEASIIEYNSTNFIPNNFENVKSQIGSDNFKIHQLSCSEGSVFGFREPIRNARLRRQATDFLSEIEAPSICMGLSEAVLFEITINPVNRSNSQYPIYLQSSTLNTNENFDFGYFRILRYYVTKTTLDIDQFLFTFEKEGDYAFANSQSRDNVAIISVRENCDSALSPIQSQTSEILILRGVDQAEVTLQPNWPLIIGLTSSLAIVLVKVQNFS